MKMKFYGTLDELRDGLCKLGIVGYWEPKPNGVYMLRCHDGSKVHWASGSKTLWIDGPPESAARLRARFEALLFRDRQGSVVIEHLVPARIVDERVRSASNHHQL